MLRIARTAALTILLMGEIAGAAQAPAYRAPRLNGRLNLNGIWASSWNSSLEPPGGPPGPGRPVLPAWRYRSDTAGTRRGRR